MACSVGNSAAEVELTLSTTATTNSNRRFIGGAPLTARVTCMLLWRGLSRTGLGKRHFFCTLVIAQAEINGLAQFSIGGDFVVGDLRDEARLKICDFVFAWRIHKRCLVAYEWLELL
jgi:hypothetical protein